MNIREFATRFLGGREFSFSVERPINPGTANEILYQGKHFEVPQIPKDIEKLDIVYFSIKHKGNDLKTDLVIYVE